MLLCFVYLQFTLFMLQCCYSCQYSCCCWYFRSVSVVLFYCSCHLWCVLLVDIVALVVMVGRRIVIVSIVVIAVGVCVVGIDIYLVSYYGGGVSSSKQFVCVLWWCVCLCPCVQCGVWLFVVFGVVYWCVLLLCGVVC